MSVEIKESKIKIEGLFKGFTIAANGLATIKFKAPYTEAQNYVQLIGVQDEDVILIAKESEAEKFQKIGVVRLKEIRIKGEDGAEFTFRGENMNIPLFNSFLDKTIIFKVKTRRESLGGEDE